MLCFVYQRVFKYPERTQLICADGQPLPPEVVEKWGASVIEKYTGATVPEHLCHSYSFGDLFLGGPELREKASDELFLEKDVVKGLNSAGFSFEMCKFGYDPTSRTVGELQKQESELQKIIQEIH